VGSELEHATEAYIEATAEYDRLWTLENQGLLACEDWLADARDEANRTARELADLVVGQPTPPPSVYLG
jgi:hypothetical protein